MMGNGWNQQEPSLYATIAVVVVVGVCVRVGVAEMDVVEIVVVDCVSRKGDGGKRQQRTRKREGNGVSSFDSLLLCSCWAEVESRR